MTTLIPAIGSSAFDSTGGRLLAERLEQKLDADSLLKGLGIQAQGRTTILKINYRNTRQILRTASLVAADLLTADDKDKDGIPLLKPVSCGREGQALALVDPDGCRRDRSVRSHGVFPISLLSKRRRKPPQAVDLPIAQ